MPILFTNVRVAPSVDVSSGGMPFTVQPPHPGFALIGLVIRAGSWIDQIAPVFAEMLEDGSLGPAIHGPAFGGHGGVTQELRCAPGYVVTGIQTRSGHYVDAVRLMQTRWDGTLTSETTWTAWAGGLGGVERIERMSEPFGNAVAVGIAGRAGQYLDNLTIVTAELMKVSGTVVSTAKNTGRSKTSAAALG